MRKAVGATLVALAAVVLYRADAHALIAFDDVQKRDAIMRLDTIEWVRAGSLNEATSEPATRLVAISLKHRRLWVHGGGEVLFSAPVAVGKGTTLRHGGREWTFETPRGRRVVLKKEANRTWVPPDWHYVEVAQENSLELVSLSFDEPAQLTGGRQLAVRNRRVVLIHSDGTVEELPRGEEIVFDGRLFVPPQGTLNREIEGELGAFSLDIGDGYLIHGTPHTTSIGEASSHGCIRLRDADILSLAELVPVGTPVRIY